MMKTITLLAISLLVLVLSFGQIKYHPSEVIVVTLKPANSTFDES